MEGGSNTPDKQEDVKFDASQYEFFGKDVMELELGGSYNGMLETETFNGYISVPGNAKGKHVSSSFSDELATTFDQLIMINEPRNSSSIIQKPSFPKPPGFNRYKETVPPHGRLYGTVKWYSNERGYGFLTSTESKDDIFVHSSSLKTDGCIHLTAGTGVEFEVVYSWDRKPQAINVTAPGGRLLKDTRKVGNGGNSTTNGSCDGGCSSETNVMNTSWEVGPCFRCGQWGHIAKDCIHMVGKPSCIMCYNCGNMGHLVPHCPYAGNDGF